MTRIKLATSKTVSSSRSTFDVHIIDSKVFWSGMLDTGDQTPVSGGGGSAPLNYQHNLRTVVCVWSRSSSLMLSNRE